MLTPAETEAVVLSVRVATVATLVAAAPAVAIAWALERTRFPGRLIVDALVGLPLVLPPVVTGYLLLVLLGRNGPLGSVLHDTFGVTFAFTWYGAALASAVVAFPLFVRAVRLAIAAIDPGLEQAARTLGAGPLRVFFGITVPLALPGIAAGAALAFARSLGEFGATIMLAGNIAGETRTVPLAIYTAVGTPGGEEGAVRLVVLAVAVSFVAMLGGEWTARRAGSRAHGGR